MRTLSSVFLFVAALPAQNVFHGNGILSAYVENTPGVLGQQLTVGYGSPTAVLPIALFGLSDGVGPVFVPHPLLGNIGLDLFSPAYRAFTFGLDGLGNGSASLLLPPGYPLPGDPPLFAHAATFEAAGISISKTVRIDWANPNGWEAVAPLLGVRQLHTATPLGSGPRDNVTEVLICGGATGSFIIPSPLDTAELYSPLHRATTPLPNLSLPRSLHRAVRLHDGRILVTGGVTTGGLVTATCEFFDPSALAFLPAPSMNAPRSGHAMTLLDDGRVLVSGGVADWQNAGAQFIAALNTSQDTAEVFDPATNTWSPLPNMASRRLGHSQTKLLDGRVLVVSGILGGYPGAAGGGQVPRYTASCEIFDPVTNTFTAAAPLMSATAPGPFNAAVYTGRAFHGASLLPNGDVLITGGFVARIAGLINDETMVAGFCNRWQFATGTWVQVAGLPAPAAFHGQEPLGSGVLVSGGLGDGGLESLATTALTAFHDGAIATHLVDIGIDGGGTAVPRGMHTFTPLYDGTFLVYGGGVWPNTVGDGWIYTPN